MKCNHKNVTFHGMFSMIGHYVCDKCNAKIDPVVYHMIKGKKHELFHPSKRNDLIKYLNQLSPEMKVLWNKNTE